VTNSGKGNKDAPQLDQVQYGRRVDNARGENERQTGSRSHGTKLPSTAENTLAMSQSEVAIKEISNIHRPCLGQIISRELL
jgi:hypothetical protein